jgi:hypothetical protein
MIYLKLNYVSHYLVSHLIFTVFLIFEIRVYSPYNNFHTPQARLDLCVLYMVISYDLQALQKPTILSFRFLNCQDNRYLSERCTVFRSAMSKDCYC